MGISSHQTIQDQAQANGNRRLVYKYTWTEGIERFHGPKLVASAFDDATDRAGLVTFFEDQAKLDEKFDAEARAIAGNDFSDITSSLLLNTTAEAAEFILKRMSNRFQTVTKASVRDELPELLLLRKIWTELTDNQIANFMGESSVDVATWRASFATMDDGVTAYSSPFPKYTDVPEL